MYAFDFLNQNHSSMTGIGVSLFFYLSPPFISKKLNVNALSANRFGSSLMRTKTHRLDERF